MMVWRDTFEDGYIGVRNYSRDVREQTTEQLKDWKTEFDSCVTNNINTFTDHSAGQSFPVRSVLYHPGLNKYLQVKRYDEGKKIYICRPKAAEETAKMQATGDIEAGIEEIAD